MENKLSDESVPRAIANGLMSNWKSVKNSVLQASILRPVLFNIINYIDNGGEGTFNNCE